MVGSPLVGHQLTRGDQNMHFVIARNIGQILFFDYHTVLFIIVLLTVLIMYSAEENKGRNLSLTSDTLTVNLLQFERASDAVTIV